MSRELDRSIRSWTEKVLETDYESKRFIIKTYGACQANNRPLVLEANLDKTMWNHGVGKLKVGDEVVFFDINEMISYLKVCVQ